MLVASEFLSAMRQLEKGPQGRQSARSVFGGWPLTKGPIR